MSSSINTALVRKYLYELYKNDKIEGLERDRLFLLVLKHLPSFQRDYLRNTIKNKHDNSLKAVNDLMGFYDDEDNHSEADPFKKLITDIKNASEKARFLELIELVKALISTRIASETDPWDYSFLETGIQGELFQEIPGSGEEEVKCIKFGLACNIEPMLYQYIQYTSINPLTFFKLISHGFGSVKIFKRKKTERENLFCPRERRPSSRIQFFPE